MASSSAAAAPNLGPPPTMKLSRENYTLWKAQVLPAIRGARLMGLLDGKEAAPSETLPSADKDKSPQPNPEFDAWVARDQQVLSYLLQSLTLDILLHVHNKEHAVEVWTALAGMFASQARARITNLRIALGNTMKRELTIDAFFSKMKKFRDELTAAGSPVSDARWFLSSSPDWVRTTTRSLPLSTHSPKLSPSRCLISINSASSTTSVRRCSTTTPAMAASAPPPMQPIAIKTAAVAGITAAEPHTVAVVTVAVMTVTADGTIAATEEGALRLLVVVAVVVAVHAPLPGWTPRARSATRRDMLLETAGGDLRTMMMIMMIRRLMGPPTVLIPTNILTPVRHTTSQGSWKR